jgi:hypothetical protein
MFGGNNNTAADSTVATPPAGTSLPQVDTSTSAPSYDSNGFLTTDPAAATAPVPATTESVAPAATPATSDVPGAPQLSTPVVDSTPVADVATTPAPPAPAAVGASDDLLDIKQQALQQLSPLVGHLDQTPEEKFRTTMMMIQAADDQSLIQQAYEAAQAIPDEKTKAQALLDIVNEINYFTQSHEQ